VPARVDLLEGLVAACDRALERLRDPVLPGPVDRTLVEHIVAVRARALTELATAPHADDGT
jgi:hypothetical protein